MADTYSWIGASGGSWASGSNWADLTAGTSPAGTQPGALDPVIITGLTGSAYELITGGGVAASLSLSRLLDLAGSYAVGGALVVNSGSLLLDAGSTITAGSIELDNGHVAIAGSGAALISAGSVTLDANGYESLSIGAGASFVAAGVLIAGNSGLTMSGGSAQVGALTVSEASYISLSAGATLTATSITAPGNFSVNDSRLISTGAAVLGADSYFEVYGNAYVELDGLQIGTVGSSGDAYLSISNLSTFEIGTHSIGHWPADSRLDILD